MMVQERLEGLLLMSVERKILLTLPHEAIIQQVAQSSAELSRALTCSMHEVAHYSFIVHVCKVLIANILMFMNVNITIHART